MSLLITDAFAQTGTTQAVNPFGSLFMLAGFILIFYFMLWRPQSKRAKEQRELISNLAKGDEVVTNGGILGRIIKLTDDFVVVAVADGVDINVQKPAITAVLPSGTLKSI